MIIHAIGGREVWFYKYFKKYREFTSLNFFMHLLCYRRVVLHDFYTQVMLIQSSNVVWFLCFPVCFILLQISFVTLLLFFMYTSCSDSVVGLSIFYDSIRKHCHVTVILSQGRIFSTDLLQY